MQCCLGGKKEGGREGGKEGRARVYYPDEHKIAVYLPLLGPVGVPLVVALVKEVKRFWM